MGHQQLVTDLPRTLTLDLLACAGAVTARDALYYYANDSFVRGMTVKDLLRAARANRPSEARALSRQLRQERPQP